VVQADLDRENWLADADSTKQQGFYSDQIASGWSTPTAFQESDWKEAHRHVSSFLRETDRQLRIFESSDRWSQGVALAD
jgi:hypothetical protein